MSNQEERSLNGEKEFGIFMKNRRNALKYWFLILLIFIVFIPVIAILPKMDIVIAIAIMFTPILVALIATLVLLVIRPDPVDFLFITRNEIFVWSKEECHVLTEQDLSSVVLRSWKKKSRYPDLPKSIDFNVSRTSYHRTSSGSTSSSKESIRYIITLKDKTKYYSQIGYKYAKGLLKDWINFYSNSEAEETIKKTVVGKKIKRSK